MFERHQNAEIACIKFEMRALEKTAVVSRPVTDAVRYDRIVDWNGRLYRVQIKFGNGIAPRSTGSIRVDLRKRGRTYSKDEIDVVAVYLPQIDKICWFGPEMFDGKSGLCIRLKPTRSGQKIGCVSADDHIW